MAGRVPWGLQDLDAGGPEGQLFAFFNRNIDARDIARFFRGPIYGAVRLTLQSLMARDMIEMRVRCENMRQRPASVAQRLADSILVGGVDGSGRTRGTVMDQDSVIVASAGKLSELDRGHGSPDNLS